MCEFDETEDFGVVCGTYDVLREKPHSSGHKRRRTMILFKSCPRCSGGRVHESDAYGPYILCLACGHVAYPDPGTLVETDRARKAA